MKFICLKGDTTRLNMEWKEKARKIFSKKEILIPQNYDVLSKNSLQNMLLSLNSSLSFLGIGKT